MSKLRRLLPLIVIAVAIIAAVVLIRTRPEPAIEPPRQNGEVVEVQPVTRRVEPLRIEARGRVIPAREVVVQPQVSGRVATLSPDLVPGGVVAEGAVLFTVETVDFELALEQARTRLAEAEAALALERGRQAVAQREYALFEDDLPAEQDPALALREPQLKSAQARVAAAQAQLRQARLNLARTEVVAPFNAVVRAENVDSGQFVTPQTQAIRLIGTDAFWVQVSVPVADLPLIVVPDGERPGARAKVRYDTGPGVIERAGTVLRRLPDLDPAGQMARVLLAVNDPLGLDSGAPPLLLESFVDVEIDGNRDVEVVSLPRKHLHNDNEVYVYADGLLDIRRVEVVWRRRDTVLIGDGLDDGDIVVVSSLSTPVAGMKLRREQPDGVANVTESRQ